MQGIQKVSFIHEWKLLTRNFPFDPSTNARKLSRWSVSEALKRSSCCLQEACVMPRLLNPILLIPWHLLSSVSLSLILTLSSFPCERVSSRGLGRDQCCTERRVPLSGVCVDPICPSLDLRSRTSTLVSELRASACVYVCPYPCVGEGSSQWEREGVMGVSTRADLKAANKQKG